MASLALERERYAASIPAFWQAISGFMGSANGSHANGLTSVPYDGYKAILHRNERVLTAREASEYDGQSESDDETVRLLRELLVEVKAGTKSSKAVADTLTRVTRNGNALKTEAA